MSEIGSRIVSFGECMVELRRKDGPLMVQSYGGDTLNTATYLARLSEGRLNVSYATALGEADAFSHAMVAGWSDEGIDISYIRRLSGQLPGLYTIDVDAKGERTFAYWRDNSAARKYFDEPGSPIETGFDAFDVFYFSGISIAILPLVARETLFRLIVAMRTAGKTIVFDNNYRPRLWASSAECGSAYEKAFELADIALVTLTDEMERFDMSDESVALAKVLSLPSPELVVKRGAAPALVRNNLGQVTEVAAEKVEYVADTTAAGDSFGAGYLAARMLGKTPVEAARIGNRLAAVVIQHPGAIIPVDKMPNLL